MASTPKFDWPTPNDTDFVKFGAAAIRALGDAADETVDGIDGRLTAAEGDVAALDGRVASVEVGFRYVGSRYFTSPGIDVFEKADPFDDGNPSGLVVRAIRVKVHGGGGAGGGAAASPSPDISLGGGGGSGSYAELLITDIAGLDASVDVTVGAGGAGAVGQDNLAEAGGTSSFGTVLACAGGIGGRQRGPTSDDFPLAGSEPTPPPTAGDFRWVGISGDGVIYGDLSSGGRISGNNGAPSFYGGGGQGALSRSNGDDAVAVGAGGGGATARRQNTARRGGDGGNGIVVIDVFA